MRPAVPYDQIRKSNFTAANVQETGRCGRDGESGIATIFCNSSDIGANVQHLDDKMRGYILPNECCRNYILAYFGYGLTTVPKDSCCDNFRVLVTTHKITKKQLLSFCLFGAERCINSYGSLASDDIKLNMMWMERVKNV